MICVICHFATLLDDVVVSSPSGRCACLRCYGRHTQSQRDMPKELREEIIRMLGVTT